MKKSSLLFFTMLTTTIFYVFTQYIIFNIIDINTGDNHILAMTLVNVVYVCLSLVMPLIIIFGIRAHKTLVNFSYGIIAFSLVNLVYHIVRHTILVGGNSFPEYVVSNLFLIILTGIYFVIVGFMVYQLYLYWKYETSKFIKFNLTVIVVSLLYNLQVFNILRYRYLITASISTLNLYSNISMFVMIILQFLNALMVYALALKNEE